MSRAKKKEGAASGKTYHDGKEGIPPPNKVKDPCRLLIRRRYSLFPIVVCFSTCSPLFFLRPLSRAKKKEGAASGKTYHDGKEGIPPPNK
jgi:hypothetical protein